MSIESMFADYENDDMPLFNQEAGEKARDEGIERALAPSERQWWIEEARSAARRIALRTGRVTADDVAAHFKVVGINIHQKLGNAMGGLFRGKEWEWTGGFIRSAQVGNHARVQRVWRLAA